MKEMGEVRKETLLNDVCKRFVSSKANNSVLSQNSYDENICDERGKTVSHSADDEAFEKECNLFFKKNLNEKEISARAKGVFFRIRCDLCNLVISQTGDQVR